MGLTVRATLADAYTTLERQSPARVEVRQAVLISVGFVLVAQQRRHFSQLSRTGSANGVSWMAPRPATVARRRRLAARGLLRGPVEAQGVVTGELAASFAFKLDRERRTVKLFNDDPKFNVFDYQRRIYPHQMPAAWQASAERVAQRMLDRMA